MGGFAVEHPVLALMENGERRVVLLDFAGPCGWRQDLGMILPCTGLRVLFEGSRRRRRMEGHPLAFMGVGFMT